jgi:hypothetical protein
VNPSPLPHTICQAIEKQPGLKLEMQKRPMPVTVIGHLERLVGQGFRPAKWLSSHFRRLGRLFSYFLDTPPERRHGPPLWPFVPERVGAKDSRRDAALF